MPSRQDNRRSLSASDKLALLRRHPLFGAIGPELLERLSSYATTRAVHRGDSIFAKGDPGNSLYAVCAGTVKISVPSADGKDAVFNLVGEGEIFGEIALLDGRPRTADATAMSDCELMVIARRDCPRALRGLNRRAVAWMKRSEIRGDLPQTQRYVVPC